MFTGIALCPCTTLSSSLKLDGWLPKMPEWGVWAHWLIIYNLIGSLPSSLAHFQAQSHVRLVGSCGARWSKNGALAHLAKNGSFGEKGLIMGALSSSASVLADSGFPHPPCPSLFPPTNGTGETTVFPCTTTHSTSAHDGFRRKFLVPDGGK